MLRLFNSLYLFDSINAFNQALYLSEEERLGNFLKNSGKNSKSIGKLNKTDANIAH